MTDGSIELPLRWTEGVKGPSWQAIVTLLVAFALFGMLNAVLTRSCAARLPGWVFVGLLILANLALLAPTLGVLSRVHTRRGASDQVLLRIGPDALELDPAGRPLIRITRAELRVRRLHVVYEPPISDSAPETIPDRVGLELSGSGVPPVVVYKPSLWSGDRWARPDGTITHLPEFELDEPGWTILREALDVADASPPSTLSSSESTKSGT